MKTIINYINDTLKKEKPLLFFTFIVFTLGLLLGTIFITMITEEDKTLLLNQLSTYLESTKKLSKDVFGIVAFKSCFLNNFIQLLILFILGISMIGILAVIIILFFKGFMIGTSLSTFILKFKVKGILGCFLYVFPTTIINILIFILLSFYAVYVSKKFLYALFKKDNLNFKTFLGKYLLTFVICVILMFFTCFLESFLTPFLLKLFNYAI